MGGFIVLFRKMVDWEWYTDGPCFKLFIHCLLKANYEEKHWRGIMIPRGSFVTSYPKLAKETGLTVQQLRTALKKLISTNELTKESTSDYTLISVVNYGRYQDYGSDKQQGNQHTNQQATNRLSTGYQQQLTNITNKQDNDNDNDKGAGALIHHHQFTNLLIKKRFLFEDDEKLFTYDKLFNDLLDSYKFLDVVSAIDYVLKIMKNVDVKNKYGYFKTSMEKQLNPFRRLNQESNAVEPVADDTNISDQELRELLKEI